MGLEPTEHIEGNRYLHGKTSKAVTLRYIGPLPPTTLSSTAPPTTSPSAGATIWLGIEYDDASQGKHSGIFQGNQVFKVKAEGAGAFIKASPGALKKGPTLIEALQERYGSLLPTGKGAADRNEKPGRNGGIAERVALGASGIMVDAPGLSAVQARIGRLERLREVGLDYEWVSELGGTDEQREAMRSRLKGERDRFRWLSDLRIRCAYAGPDWKPLERMAGGSGYCTPSPGTQNSDT